MDGYGVFFITCAIIIIISLIMIPGEKRKIAAQEAAKKNMSYDKRTKILTLHKRAIENSELIAVVSDYNFTTAYKPEQLVYTGATVGGITTGGFHKEGGYRYISSAQKNGQAFLSYITTDAGQKRDNLILKVQLSDELFREAQLYNLNHLSLSSKSIELFSISGKKTILLTYDDVTRIKNFICSE